MTYHLLKIIKLRAQRCFSMSFNPDKSKVSDLKYTPLSPKPNNENTKHYVEALDYAVAHPRISNIAITGAYGSGKSTIIETYIEQNPHKECIKISLAEFSEKNGLANGGNGGEAVVKQELELSILQQLFYQRGASNLPDSRFDRIGERSSIKMSLVAIFILIYLGVLATIFTKEGLGFLLDFCSLNAEEEAGKVFFLKNLIYFIFIVMSFFGLIWILNKVKSIRNFNLKLETLGEIALDNKEGGSILNLYFDEIRYFFYQTKVEVVFIEDLDRFKTLNIELFTKLRELNILLNSSLNRPGKRNQKVNFVYALKDELFTEDGERTKFFDFLIPVIPFVNYSNTGAKLISGLKEHEAEIGKEFIFELSPYLSEMRLVHNIINEFEIYLLNLRQFVEDVDELITKQKLFAFIVYKNVFPVDFAKLNSGEGMVFSLLGMRQKIILGITAELNSTIDVIQRDVIDSKNLIHKSLEDNKLLLAAKFMEKLGASWGQVYIGGQPYQRQSTTLVQVADALIQSPEYSTTPHGPSKLSFEKEVSDYLEKERLINFLDKSKSARIEISNIRNKIRTLREKTLAELLQAYPEQEKLLIECLKSNSDENPESIAAIDKNQLLIKLVRDGYIDNSYHHYLTYYHPTSEVSLSDMRFILHVRSKANTGKYQDYLIQNIGKVFSELRSDDFESPASWNISLVDYLIQNGKPPAIQSLITGFKKDDASLDFIKKYFYSKPNFEALMQQFSVHWPEAWDELTKSQTDQENTDLLVKLLDDLDKESWINLATHSSIKEFIETDSDFIEKVQKVESIEKLQLLFDTIEIKFSNLNLSLPLGEKEGVFLKIIAERFFYQLNDKMLTLLVSLSCPDSISEYATKQLSLLLEGSCEVVRERIKTDFDEYLAEIYLSLKRSQQDPEEFLLRLLNDKIIEDLSFKAKCQIIEKQKTRFSSIEKIQNRDLWELVYNLRLVVPSWENVAQYFHYNEGIIDEALLSALSDKSFVDELCANEMIVNEIDGLSDEFDGLTEKLSIALIEKTQIPDREYREIARSICFSWVSYPLSKLSKNKVKILIEENNLSFSQENFDALIKYDQALALQFIGLHFSLLINKLSAEEIEFPNRNFLKAALTSNDLSDTQKAELLSVAPQETLAELEIDVQLVGIFLKLVDVEDSQWNIKLLEHLMSSEVLTLEDKLNIVSSQVKFISDHRSLHKLLVPFGKSYDEILIKGSGSVVVDDTKASRRFFSAMNMYRGDWIGQVKYMDSTPKDLIRVYLKKLY